MTINNAAEAAEIVRQFLAQMGSSTFITPAKAERTDSLWTVDFRVGFKVMRFEIDGTTSEILRYWTL